MPEDLKNLGQKLDQLKAQKQADKQANEASDHSIESAAKGTRAGGDFLASVIAGGLVGYAIDYFAGTLPWGMIAFLILGFVTGVVRANKANK